MSEHEQKCENNAVFKLKYTAKMLVTFKMAYSCCFSLGGNQDFLDYLPKNFYNINYRILHSYLIFWLIPNKP